MGPVAILDKSAFQAFSWREHVRFGQYFHENVVPILVHEIVADLSKTPSGEKTPEERVRVLAQKFGGSGGAANLDWSIAGVASLAGSEVPMTGQVLLGQWKTFQESDGSLSALIEPSAINHLILKLAYGTADEAEKEFARTWRAAASNLSLDDLKGTLGRHFVVIPRAEKAEDVRTVCDGVLRDSGLQEAWLECLLKLLGADEAMSAGLRARRRSMGQPRIETFAPYAHHCLRVLLILHVACRDGFLSWQPTHLLDAQYLYYLPFCAVFSSDDHVHRLLAPMLLRDDQSFVAATDLKSGLRAIADFLDERSEQERLWISYALGSHPPPLLGNTVSELWRRHWSPWTPNAHNRAVKLSEEEAKRAVEYVRSLFSKAAA